MAAYNKFDQFVEDKNKGVHNMATNQLVVALTNTLPTTGLATLSEIAQIDYANLDSRNITTNSAVQTAGVFKLEVADLVLTAAGVVPEFQYVVIYNDTPTSPADPLIAWYAYPSKVNMQLGEKFTVNFDQLNGLYTDE